jgi:hypothetical protein
MEIQDGYYDGQILSAEIIRSRFAKDESDQRLEVELTCGVYDSNHQPMSERAVVYLELSSEFPKYGDTTKPFWQQTMEQLKELGMNGDDLTTLGDQLKNKPCRLNYRSKDKNGCALKNPGWYLTRARERVAIKGADANAMLRQMMGGGGAPASAPAQSAPSNPFN